MFAHIRHKSPFAVALATLIVLLASSTTHATAPNILLVVADDMTWTDAGCYGSSQVRTPHLDRLAADGAHFSRCFTSTAMCAATRQQLYTGLFPVRSGAYPNHSEVYPGTPSIVHHLGELGYRTAIAGKTHFGPTESFPFENLGRITPTRPDQPEFDYARLAEFIGRDRDEPYCLVVASNQPHSPWTLGDASAYPPDELELPPYLVDTPATRRALSAYYAEITYLDNQLGRLLELVDESGQANRTIVIFTSEQGAAFPHGKWTCYDVGLLTQLVIRWPGKIAPGEVKDAMVQYVDVLPTLIAAAGGDPAVADTGRPGAAVDDGGSDDRGVDDSGFDGRSFLGVLTGATDSHRDAVFGCHTTRGIKRGTASYPIRSIRTERYKLIHNLNAAESFHNVLIARTDSDVVHSAFWTTWVAAAADDPLAAQLVHDYQHRGELELYDIQRDPLELENLAGRPELRPLIESLGAQLAAWMRGQGDAGLATEAAAFTRQREPRAGR